MTTPKKLTGQIQVHFQTNGLVEEFPLQVLVSAANQKFEKFDSAVKLLKEPKVLVILKSKVVEASESEAEINIQGEILVEVLEANMVSPVFPSSLSAPVFNPGKNIFTLLIEGGVSAVGSVESLIMTNPLIGKKKTVAELKASYPSNRVAIKGANLELNLDGLIQKSLTKKNDVKIKLSADLSVQGVLLNSKKPEMFREYNLELKK